MSPSVITGLLALAAVLAGAVAAKFLRPNASALDMIQEIQEERAEDRKVLNQHTAEIRQLKTRDLIWQDYTGQLRQDYTEATGRAARPYPEGLTS